MSVCPFNLFAHRHISSLSKTNDTLAMLQAIGVNSIEDLISQTIPANIRSKKTMNIPPAQTEAQFLSKFKQMMQQNKLFKSYIGCGYYGTHTPTVILRNILENPGWYTAYTPYQAEIAQGRLEMLLNYQTMVIELTGMEIANASLLDEATAAAEAMTMLYQARKGNKKNANVFLVSEQVHPQTIALLHTRAIPLNIELKIVKHFKADLTEANIYGMLLQYPCTDGSIEDYTNLIAAAKENNIYVSVASDLLALTLLTPPGEIGADVVFGSSQRMGVPMGYGGPHAAFFATKNEFKRLMPGRIIGVSVDAHGNKAYRMALQTREQHIKREKATSNICTAQVLLSVVAAAYAMYHGKEGLKNIAENVHQLTAILAKHLQQLGFETNTTFFDTICVKVDDKKALQGMTEALMINLRYFETNHVGISLDETTTLEDVQELITLFAQLKQEPVPTLQLEVASAIPATLQRKSDFLTHTVFNSYQSEHEMLRYLKRLENKDLSLTHSMISLGSCTMKLNATTEMIPVTWAEVNSLHPFVPTEQAKGYAEMFEHLTQWLCEITGFAGVSLQPNSGAQGEFAGLMVIRAYHESRNEKHRNIALIPTSAHGTNPASAVMAGMKVVLVKCNEKGYIDITDLKAQAEKHKDNLSCLMVTYPSTHGVFEEDIIEICQIIHDNGGQVYMDGANMNAQVGLTSPGLIGADVCHLNLHKTFCIPHGGGGPGMGPIGVAAHLVPFLPGHPLVKTGGEQAITPISAAPFGSASILPISYAYIAMMGADGLKKATEYAILNANYIKARLEKYYPVLYTNHNGRVAHEMIIDLRPFKQSADIEAEDVAKRLMDYGYHAPTMSFPVAGTIMIEPTESESKAELDRFCEALIAIRQEIAEIEQGIADRQNNVLKNAPHTAQVLLADTWDKPYSREKAAYPLNWVKEAKFFPAVSRIDNAYGDRNLVCSCLPLENYATEEATA